MKHLARRHLRQWVLYLLLSPTGCAGLVSACRSKPAVLLLALPPNANHACREYKPILKAAYFTNSSDPQSRGKFSLELTKSESIGLCQAFDRKAGKGGSKSSQRPQPIPGPSAAPTVQR